MSQDNVIRSSKKYVKNRGYEYGGYQQEVHELSNLSGNFLLPSFLIPRTKGNQTGYPIIKEVRRTNVNVPTDRQNTYSTKSWLSLRGLDLHSSWTVHTSFHENYT